jgi:hypothetical protein
LQSVIPVLGELRLLPMGVVVPLVPAASGVPLELLTCGVPPSGDPLAPEASGVPLPTTGVPLLLQLDNFAAKETTAGDPAQNAQK